MVVLRFSIPTISTTDWCARRTEADEHAASALSVSFNNHQPLPLRYYDAGNTIWARATGLIYPRWHEFFIASFALPSHWWSSSGKKMMTSLHRDARCCLVCVLLAGVCFVLIHHPLRIISLFDGRLAAIVLGCWRRHFPCCYPATKTFTSCFLLVSLSARWMRP